MAGNGKAGHVGNRRSRVLWEITALVVVVYLIGGLAAFLIAQNSYNNLSRKSTDKLIQEKAQTISSSYNYLATAEMEILLEKYGAENIDRGKLYSKLLAGNKNDLDPLQKYLVDATQGMIDKGLLGLNRIFIVVPPSSLTPNPITIVSNDPDYIFFDFPDRVDQAIKDGEPWLLLEEGLPTLGLTGDQLVTLSQITSPVSPDVKVTFLGITPMGEDVAEIKQFYDDEKKATMVDWAVTTLVSIVVIMLLTFFVLRLLIRKRITEPIDVLSAEAGEIMEGNLDIDVVVHEGGEFQGLETAFKNMVETFRAYIAKSMDED